MFVIAFIALWFGYSRVMASARLKVSRVEVRGGHFLSEGEVRELLGPAVGENILSLDIDGLKKRLRDSPWVADAAVQRTLPDTLRVEIDERAPVALAEIDQLYLMDEHGTLIELYGPRTAGFDLPVVRGLGGLGLDERRERARRVTALLLDLQELAAELSEVRVEDSGELETILRTGEVVRLGAPPYRKRFMTFLGLRGQLRQRCPDAEYFDLRFRDRIYAKERMASAAVVAGR
jgi:cell division septal protein FtsQ